MSAADHEKRGRADGAAGPSLDPPPARRMAAWKIVALTLGGVLGAGLIFVAGLVTGVALSGVAQQSGPPPSGRPGGPATEGTGPTSGSATGAPSGTGGSEALGSCLVGTWRTTEYEQRASGPQGESVLTGLERTFTFDESGRHVVTYDNDEATMTVQGASSTMVFDGTVEYQVSVSGSTMSFELLSSEGTMTIPAPDGSTEERPLQPGTGSVTFTCSGDVYTEEDGRGFRETATRVG